MPAPASPATNQYRCDMCGRHFNTEEELRSHAQDCAQAYQPGKVNRREEQPAAAREEGPGRDWVSTP